MSLARRPQHVGRMISAAARAFTDGRLLPRPDLIALQEADKGTARTGGHHVAKELAEEMGMHWVHAPAGIPRGVAPAKRQWWLDFEEPIDLHDSGDTGVALLTRLPLSDVQRIDLPWQECPWRPRLGMAATIALGSREIRLFNAHVDPHMGVGGQLAQLEAIAEQAETSTIPTIILGDFNTLSKTEMSRHAWVSRGAWLHFALANRNRYLARCRFANARRLDLHTRSQDSTMGCGAVTPERLRSLAHLG